MNCPFCLKLNLYHNLVLLPGIYVCENDDCIFCETSERFEELYRKNNLSVTNIKEKDIISNDQTKSFIISGVSDHNELGDEHDIQEYRTSEILIQTNSNIDNLLQQFDNTCNYLMDWSNENEEQNENKLGNDENEILSTDESNYSIVKNRKSSTHAHIFNTLNDSKSKMMDRILTANVSYGFWPTTNTIFNWLRMPYYFRTHSKIIRILLLHLDIFKFNDVLVDDLKKEYCVIDAFANNFNSNSVKYMCYNFLQKLYETLDNISDKDFHGKPVYEKVMRLLLSLFEKYDLTNHFKVKYTSELSCSSCNVNCTTISNDYFVKLTRHQIPVEIQKNKIIYQSTCVKCKNLSTTTIIFESIPQFLIFYCPKGLRTNFLQYDQKMVSDDNKTLSVVAVIETDSKYSQLEYKETPIDWIAYRRKDIDNQSNGLSGYGVHFQNTNGWYSLNDWKDFLCHPRDAPPSVDSLSDVRFLILGTVSDPATHRSDSSVRAFVKANERFIVETIKSHPKKSEFDLLCKKMLHRMKYRKIRNKKKFIDDSELELHLMKPPIDDLWGCCDVDLDRDQFCGDRCSHQSDIVDNGFRPQKLVASSSSSSGYFSKSCSSSYRVTTPSTDLYNYTKSIVSTTDTFDMSSTASTSLCGKMDIPKSLTERTGKSHSQRSSFTNGDSQQHTSHSQKRINIFEDLISKHRKKLKARN